jgi:hypothetical protein
MKKSTLLIINLILCTIPGTLLSQNNSGLSIEKTENQISIGNSFIKRTFSTANNKVTTTSITNYRTDGTPTMFIPGKGSEEFVMNTLEPEIVIDLGAISKTAWTITASSYSTTETAPSGPPQAFIDGKTNTHWHSNYGTGVGGQNYPHWVTIDLQQPESFKSFTYTPRQDGENANGNILQYEIYTSNTENSFPATPTKKGSFTYSGAKPIHVNFDTEITARYVKFIGLSAKNGLRFAGGAEFDLNKQTYVAPEQNLPTAYSKTGWTVEGNSVTSSENAPFQAIIDNNINTFWHSNYGSGTGPTTLPFYFIIDMKESKLINTFSYLPRQTGGNGIAKDYELYISETKEGLETALASNKGILDQRGTNATYVSLNNPVSGRFVKFVIRSTWNGGSFGSCAEFDLYAEKYTAPKLKINTSDLELDTVTYAQTLGHPETAKIRFEFKPYTVNDINWSIKMVVSMNEDDHYMRKHLEISVPESQQSLARIDYIDGEHLKINTTDKTWSRPNMEGGVGGMNGYLISTGQPVYIQGMFFGSEFPHTETSIGTDSIGHIRYFSGKNFAMFKNENRLTDNTFSTWKTVAGAARSTDIQVIQSDFFEYIRDISTPSNFRMQYNSWYDFMMDINENNIQSSFWEMEKGFTQYAVPPMHSYVVDDGWNAYGPFASENTTGFWQFNSKFPNGLTNASDLAHRFSSSFGLWLGPRGGYNYNADFARFLQNNENGEYNPGSADIVTNHKRYLELLNEFFLDAQDKYKINYWKFDGFTTTPPTSKSDQRMSGGEQGMYYMTEHWERWIDILKNIRNKSTQQQQDMWINLTCYVNPSPWYLQWANSVWIQNSTDIGRHNTGRTRQVDQLLSYRDGRYFDFNKVRQFQFPFANIYNHDPIYGKTGTNLANQMTDDEFRAYLFMMATRGSAFWELYYSYNMLAEGQKWMINAEALNWIDENFHILRNSKIIGETPETAGVYGYSCWDGFEGIVSVRNPATTAKTFTLTLDRNIGVKEGTAGLHRVSILNFNTTTPDNNSGTYDYGQQISLTLQPGEIRIWQFSPEADNTSAVAETVKTISNNNVTLKFNERVSIDNAVFKINNVAATTKTLAADYKTVTLSTSTLTAYNGYEISYSNVKDYSGNISDGTVNFVHYPSSLVAKADSLTDINATTGIINEFSERMNKSLMIFENAAAPIVSEHAIAGVSDFNISLHIQTSSKSATFFKQGTEISLATDAESKIVFNVKDLSVTSRKALSADSMYFVSVCREKNGMLKIYINGQLDNSVYNKNILNQNIQKAQIQLGSSNFSGKITSLKVHNKAYAFDENTTLFNNQPWYFKMISSAGNGGTISPLGKKMVQRGKSQAYVITPDNGYEVEKILINGNEHINKNKIQYITNILADHNIEVQFVPVSGVEHIFGNIVLYPNPVETVLYIKGADNATITLTNLNGQMLQKVKTTQNLTEINMEQFSAGIYLVKIEKDNASQTYRVAKTK